MKFKNEHVFKILLRMCSNMLSTVNMTEHNETMNIMKHKASLLKVKPEMKKDEHNK